MTTPVVDPVVEDVSDLSDEEIMRRIQNEMASRPQPKGVTIGELFVQLSSLVASATGKTYANGPRISEQSAVRVLELTLMWALNNRGGASHDILPEEMGGSGEEPEYEAPDPSEVIEASADQSEE